jgi:hypothetical protein
MTIASILTLLLLLGLLEAAATTASSSSRTSSTRVIASPDGSSSKGPLIFNATVLTWNMAEASPTEEDCDFIKSFKDSDLVVMGVQECEDIKPRRHEGRRSRTWRAFQIGALGSTYDVIAQHKIGGIQIAVYAKKRLASRITGVLVLDVACGIGNVLNNKGGN